MCFTNRYGGANFFFISTSLVEFLKNINSIEINKLLNNIIR